MTLSDLHAKWESILAVFKDPVDHLSAILFAAGHDHAEIVMVPLHDGVLHLEHWLSEPHLLNLYASSTETDVIGIRRKIFKRFPTSHSVPFTHAYTVLYWTQGRTMPVNQSLLKFCTGTEEYRMLRGNVLVLKHCQSSFDGFEDMHLEDVALVGAIIGSAVAAGQLDCVDEYDFTLDLEVIEL
ncbi:hypothetical protein J3R83DRAFT_1330 [Lanmaoa asiatica]|nr:hypothetical protein J3R83DRAFT_1330 [Lanmaoa asiatica]